MTQKQRPPKKRTEEQPQEQAPQTTENAEDIDALMEEIDAVLEKNAEEFVKGFVQKGGQ